MINSDVKKKQQTRLGRLSQELGPGGVTVPGHGVGVGGRCLIPSRVREGVRLKLTRICLPFDLIDADHVKRGGGVARGGP